MTRLFTVGLIGSFLTVVALAQDTAGTSETQSNDTPASKVKSGAVRERAPGRIIDAARQRHNDAKAQRLQAQRGGDVSSLAPEGTGTVGGSSNPLNNLLGGLLGSLGGNVGDLIGGLSNGTGTAGGANIPSNITPEAIAMLEAAGFNINDLFPGTAQVREVGGGLVAAGDEEEKVDPRVQAANGTGNDRSFATRWADAMLSTLFTALVVGFQTPDFINVLADLVRPMFGVQTDTAGQTAGDGAAGDTTPAADGAGGDAGDGTPVDDSGVGPTGIPFDPNSIVS